MRRGGRVHWFVGVSTFGFHWVCLYRGDRLTVLRRFVRIAVVLQRAWPLRFRGAGDLPLKIILCPRELLHGLTHAAGELWQFLRTEEDQDNKENDPHVHGGYGCDRNWKCVEYVHIRQISAV